MSTNKRRDPRFDSKQKLWCEGQTEFGEARNMSRSGMFIVAEQPREIGEQLKVSFDGEEGAVELQVQVMWRGSSAEGGRAGMGLRIVGFDRGEDVYDRFVREQLAQQGLSRPRAGKDAK